jgi:hypothetical protein
MSVRREMYLQPADFGAELPGEGKMLWLVTFQNCAPGIPNELVPATGPEVALDRQERTGKAFGIGNRIPEVVDIGIVDAREAYCANGLAVAFAFLDRTVHGAKHF